jgi:hypothetical protein
MRPGRPGALLDKISAGWPTRLTWARRHRDPGLEVVAGVAHRGRGSQPCCWRRRSWPCREVGWMMSNGRNAGAAAGGGAIYGLGIFGALVYFWQQADGFWEHLLAVIQGLFWPAFMVYEVFKALRRSG